MINDLDLIRTFLTVVEAGSFSAAAPGVYRSQAAVSQQVRRLEAQLGATVFERGHREVTLTDAGQRFLPHARNLLQASEQALLATRGIQQRTIRIGVADDLADALVMPALARLAEQDSSLALDITTGSTRALHAQLPSQLDIVVGLALPRLAEGRELMKLRLGWFGHWDGNGSMPLALCGEGCLLRRQALAALDQAGVPWRLRVAASNMGVVAAAAATGMAVGPMLTATAPTGLHRLRNLPALGSIGLRIYAGQHMDDPLTSQLPAMLRKQTRRHTASRQDRRHTPEPARKSRS